MKPKALIVDDEKGIRLTFSDFLTENGYEVSTAENYSGAVSLMDTSDHDIVFLDIILGRSSGIDILKEINRKESNCQVIMITGYPDIETASESVRSGAFDYISKPVEKEELLRVADKALQYKRALDEKERYKTNLEAVFDSVDDAILTIDTGMSVTEINAAAVRLCGWKREKIIGTGIKDILADCSMRCLGVAVESIKRKSPTVLEYIECRCRKPENKVVSTKARPLINRSGRFSGAVLIIRDMTKIVEMERNLAQRRRFYDLIGKSEEMQTIYSIIEDLADVHSTVLITGESGTGKELVAEAIHSKSTVRKGPLIKVNCTALSENILESELFGHVKGAFTGACDDKEGRFQIAEGGTVFLDEIGDISPKMQMQLLRVIQEKEFERVGDPTPIRIDVRIIAATNRNLMERIKLGMFREDLYYRLNVVAIELPALREKQEDIPLLISHFIDKFNKEFNKTIQTLSEDVLHLFMNYHWPGNIRELKHTLEHAFIVSRQPVITLSDLPRRFPGLMDINKREQKMSTDIDDPEIILKALEQAEWKKAKAARLLGVNRKTVYRKMRKFNLTETDKEN